jgi:hypothetical protein
LVHLSPEDRVVLSYLPDPERDNLLVMVHDQQYGAYLMLWRTGDMAPGTFEIQWRGLLEHVLDKFTTEVDSFESDRALEREKGWDRTVPPKSRSRGVASERRSR